MKHNRVLLSQDGPYSNVLKLKPPMCFSNANVDLVMKHLDAIIHDIESGQADLSDFSKPAHDVSIEVPDRGCNGKCESEPINKCPKLMDGVADDGMLVEHTPESAV